MAVELRKQALRTFRNNPSRFNYLFLKKQEASTKKTLRQSKRKGLRAFSESITSFTNISALWKMIKRFKNRFLNVCNAPLTANFGLRRTTPTNVLLAEAGALKHRFNLLSSKYNLKIFSLDSHPLIDKLYALLWYSRRTRKVNPTEKFLLFRSFCNLLPKKPYIAKFDYPAVYSIDYEALISFPTIIITTPFDVEKIKNAPIPQLVFFDIYNQLISTSRSFFTDGSKNDSDDHVGFSIYSPSPHLQLLFASYSFSSIFTAEALAILHTLEYISINSTPRSVIFTDSQSVTKALLSINLAHSYNYIIYAIKQKLHQIKTAGFEITIVWIPAHMGILGNETADYLAKKAITKVADPSCPCGAPRQDVDHVFWGCPRFNKLRTTLLSQLRKYGKIPPLKTQEILKNPSSGVIHALHAFLKSSNLNI
ncbi:uncharacterized protein LOC115238206 [Formica exsecta]|uniref:uncharacterized protein LOC115238206 n=1 Tax=Formica exsecta TaxID=72781 RepID=UPI0011412988|nr:uncharacterized protein LOC115238206 [Formica exsecta]